MAETYSEVPTCVKRWPDKTGTRTVTLERQMVRLAFSIVVMWCSITSVPCQAEWKPHDIQVVNGNAGRITLPARIQIVNEKWIPLAAMDENTFGAEVRMPYLVYLPEKKRLLMMVSVSHPGGAPYAVIIASDDLGATWSYLLSPNQSAGPLWGGFGLTYLGNGRLFFDVHHRFPPEGNQKITFSDDYGKT